MLITADTIVTGRELLRPGWIDIEGRLVRALGAGVPPRPADVSLGAVTVVPGFVDIHVHGGGGGAFPSAPSEVAAATATAVELHRRQGTTTMIASLVTAHPADLLAQVSTKADLVRSGLVAGIHLEGPWLAAERCGAHELSVLRDPDPAELDRVLAAGGGTIRMVTLAPERTGGLAAIRADRGRRCGGRGRAHRGHLRPGPGGGRRRRDGGHPPVQRDAAGASPRARSRARVDGGPAGNGGTDHRRGT